MKLEAIFKFIAKNPPSILILIGGLGWILQGLGLGKFSSWYWIIIGGIILNILWLFKD